MSERAAEVVLLDLADEGRARAERGHADNSIRGRPAGHLDRRSHRVVDRLRAGFIDQRHRAFAHVVLEQKILLGAGNDVDDRIADTEHVVAGGWHGKLFFEGRVRWEAAL